MNQEQLTGKRRYRIGFGGRLILQVEFTDRIIDPIDYTRSGPAYTYWRDATLEDITENR